MQADNMRITPAEQHCQLTQRLCLYCGANAHVIASCPVQTPRPLVSYITCLKTILSQLTTIVTLTASDLCVLITAFISRVLCCQLKLERRTRPANHQIQSITGNPLSQKAIRHFVGPVKLQVGCLHKENIKLMVLEILLGHPWLEKHDPILSWKN